VDSRSVASNQCLGDRAGECALLASLAGATRAVADANRADPPDSGTRSESSVPSRYCPNYSAKVAGSDPRPATS